MRVVILHNDLRVYWKGRIKYLREFLEAHSITLYSIELFGKGSPYAFDTHNDQHQWWSCLFPNKSSNELSKETIAKVLFETLDKIKPDIVIGPSIVFYAGALGIRWAKNNKKRFIMFDDAKPWQVKRNFFVQWVKNLITSQADAFWLPSVDYEKEYSHFLKKDVLFFYGLNSIDNNFFTPEDKKEFGHKSIICVARLVPVKNIDNLLRAWHLVEKTGTGFKLNIVGDGPEYDSLSTMVVDLGLTTVVFPGAVANTVLPSLLFNSDAFILPSISEAWGLVVNEAMAAGLPILLSNKINSTVSLLQENINGFSFNPKNVNQMADVILKYINLSNEAKGAMSVKSLEIIDAFSYENMGIKLLEAIHKITSQQPKKINLPARIIINKWYGRYDTTSWDTLQQAPSN